MLYNDDLGKLIVRLCVGGLMLFHGVNKITNGVSGIEGFMESHGLPTLFAYGAYIGEVLAPLMIIVGYQVRIAAALEAFTMLVAIYVATGFEIFTLDNHGAWVIELHLLYMLPCIALIFMGGGRYGVKFKK
ncbi:DoxX family protein [Helicobacter sp. MIT 03-1614]|jgi:putative oxidoreductase|uniref:DoxX family protein n=3 Tax=Helicobacter TaxID=209 RepID=Q7VHA8_HELHP|nr:MULTISPECIES: DoxX family protein [Helicobacter]AAP77656.1 conserved hypothetical protein [Helicobacter hepaticus ATCC 51449]TLD78308.1 DoxX family protein [Helicobacter typhlonius]TLD87991.1 DoxX family protein [Helicobacter sp. MIT 03-1614]CUU38929.1 DoxX family protein [Helicobacter typhlonius]